MDIDFCSSPGPTLGVEVELQLVDAHTRELVGGAPALLEDLRRSGAEHPKAKHELFQTTVEIITGICETVEQARHDLSSTLDELRSAAERRGIDLCCAGSHPFSDWNRAHITDNPRYKALAEEMAWLADRLQIFGVHFHVGVRSAEKVIAITNAVSAYIPHILAVSASSPYWVGHDTRLASCRSKVFEALPTAGLPEQIDTWGDFERFMSALVSAEAIRTVREVWWDVRPHPDFGTVELRMADGIPSLQEVAAVAALAQSLVSWLDTFHDRGYQLPVPDEWILRQNKWRAARYGLDATIIADDSGRTVPIRTALAELLEELAPIARRLGCGEELRALHRTLERGASYARQRAIVSEGGTLVDVVDALVAELKS